jgi:hypothetical protein
LLYICVAVDSLKWQHVIISFVTDEVLNDYRSTDPPSGFLLMSPPTSDCLQFRNVLGCLITYSSGLRFAAVEVRYVNGKESLRT